MHIFLQTVVIMSSKRNIVIIANSQDTWNG